MMKAEIAMHRAVFLDRDGVISRSIIRDGKPYAPLSTEELELLPEVPQALQLLRDAGFKLVVVTNQPDVARGALSREKVDQMNRRLFANLPIDSVKVCAHTDQDGCDCRKPKPGMLLAAARELAIDLGHSFMVGDRWRDIGAGQAAGCRTILIETGIQEAEYRKPDWIVASLREASLLILREGKAISDAF